MTTYQIKLAGKLPKGDPNGWDDTILAEDLAQAQLHGRAPVHAAIIIYDVQKTEVGDDSTITSTVRVCRVQPVSSDSGRRALEDVLHTEWAEQRGDSMIPHDVEAITKRAFADLPRTDSETDEIEEREREGMTPHDEIRRHLERVHGREDAGGLTDAEAEHRHHADHDGDLPKVLQHAREWWGWTRADIEAATAESDDPHAREDDLGALPAALYDADGMIDGGRAGSPRESSDSAQVD